MSTPPPLTLLRKSIAHTQILEEQLARHDEATAIMRRNGWGVMAHPEGFRLTGWDDAGRMWKWAHENTHADPVELIHAAEAWRKESIQ